MQYEWKVSRKLLAKHGFSSYFPGQWFQYQAIGKPVAWCQTDGLLFSYKQRKVLIIEVKYKHTIDAYWQLEQKYVPVIRCLFRDWTIATVEIVKWYDASTPFPVPVSLHKDIMAVRPNEFGVHIWNL